MVNVYFFTTLVSTVHSDLSQQQLDICFLVHHQVSPKALTNSPVCNVLYLLLLATKTVQ